MNIHAKARTRRGLLLDSLAMRLATSVFRRYLALAFVLTVFQLLVEFNAARQRVSDDLQSIANSFEGSVTKALWAMDRELLNSLASGIQSAPSVSGVKVNDEDGSTLVYLGQMVFNEADLWADRLLTVPLHMDTARGPQQLGVMYLYADASVSLNQLKASSLAIIVNSFLRALFLWVLFKWVFERNLSKPLNELTLMISRLETVADDPGAVYVPLSYDHDDELGRLIETANALQSGLISLRQEKEMLLRDLHDGLGAQIVSARLRMKDGRLSIDEAEALLADCMDELYAIIDALNDPENNLEEALVNFKDRCSKKAPEMAIKLNFSYPYGTLPPSDPRTVVQIVRILQESFTNALKHARATSIQLRVTLLDGELIIDLEDNGCGIPRNITPGRGMNNMRRRTREIGGALEVSCIDIGTRVRVKIKIENSHVGKAIDQAAC